MRHVLSGLSRIATVAVVVVAGCSRLVGPKPLRREQGRAGLNAYRPPVALSDVAKRTIDDSHELVLYRITEGRPGLHKGTFDQYQIVKRVAVRDPKVKGQLVKALYQGIAEGRNMKKCFDPGLGIRARRGSHKVDLLICFGCSWVVADVDGKEERTPISQRPKGLFDNALGRG